RQEDRHRVVRRALDLERIRQAFAQSNSTRAEHREHCRGIRRPDDRAEQHAEQDRDVQDQGGRRARHRSRDQNTERCERECRLPCRTYCVKGGAQAAVEQDYGGSDGADAVGEYVVVECDPANAHGAGQHSDREEENEDRHPGTRGELARADTNQQEQSGNQDQAVDCKHSGQDELWLFTRLRRRIGTVAAHACRKMRGRCPVEKYGPVGLTVQWCVSAPPHAPRAGAQRYRLWARSVRSAASQRSISSSITTAARACSGPGSNSPDSASIFSVKNGIDTASNIGTSFTVVAICFVI